MCAACGPVAALDEGAITEVDARAGSGRSGEET
jgi:hypothetical protein